MKCPVDIEKLYNDYIQVKYKENYEERYKGKEKWYHGSGAGSCSRKLNYESIQQAKVTAPPVQRVAQAAAAEGSTERLKDEEDAGKEKVQTTKDPNAVDTRNALKSLGARKKPVADTQLPTTTPGGVVT